MMTLQEAQERVERGARLLDAEVPSWFTLIDTGTLDMTRDCLCVLGQLEGSFTAASERRWGPLNHREPATAHGFAMEPCKAAVLYRIDDCPHCGPAWRLLQDCWVAAIADRVVASQRNDEAQDSQPARTAEPSNP